MVVLFISPLADADNHTEDQQHFMISILIPKTNGFFSMIEARKYVNLSSHPEKTKLRSNLI